MIKSVLQVYILCCDEKGLPKCISPRKAFDAYFCQNTRGARTGFETALGRMPQECEMREAQAAELLTEIAALPEAVRQVLIVAEPELAQALAGEALETPLEHVPLRIAPAHYAHLQWGNARCPGKWFMQCWNARSLPAE